MEKLRSNFVDSVNFDGLSDEETKSLFDIWRATGVNARKSIVNINDYFGTQTLEEDVPMTGTLEGTLDTPVNVVVAGDAPNSGNYAGNLDSTLDPGITAYFSGGNWLDRFMDLQFNDDLTIVGSVYDGGGSFSWGVTGTFTNDGGDIVAEISFTAVVPTETTHHKVVYFRVDE